MLFRPLQRQLLSDSHRTFPGGKDKEKSQHRKSCHESPQECRQQRWPFGLVTRLDRGRGLYDNSLFPVTYDSKQKEGNQENDQEMSNKKPGQLPLLAPQTRNPKLKTPESLFPRHCTNFFVLFLCSDGYPDPLVQLEAYGGGES